MTKLMIIERLEHAKRKGVQHPKIRLGRFLFYLAPKHGKNEGYAYINMGETYMGKIAPDGTIYNMHMTPALLKELADVLRDIPAAATAYGRKTGTCCICGRMLTAKESVAHSIGPICAEKFGFDFPKASDTIDIPEDF